MFGSKPLGGLYSINQPLVPEVLNRTVRAGNASAQVIHPPTPATAKRVIET